MDTRDPCLRDPSTPASLLADWIAAGKTDEERFEEFCRSHPENADELRRIWSAHGRVVDLLDAPSAERLFPVSRPEGAAGERSLAAGERIGEYRLVALLGRGGMGEVWVAEQPSLARRVALKLIRPDRLNAAMLELFAREARAGGRLSHPGIVGVHEHGEAGGLAWIAMELVGGARTLRDVIDLANRKGDRVETDYRRVAELVAQIADALHAAHDAGVVHRDVKPSNVLLGEDGRPRLSDFGLARIVDEAALSRTGDFAGTVAYASPEQVLGKRRSLDHRTDVFSLGAVLYELLAHRRAFEGETSAQVVDRILHEEPPDPRTLRSRVPVDLAVICAKCLQKEPSRRYASAADLARDLRRHLADEPIAARPASRWSRARKWSRRHPLLTGLGAVGATALAVISVLALQLWSEVAAVKRLSAMQRYEDLLVDADEGWPVVPARIPFYEDWLERARALRDELPSHRTRRDAFREDALPRTEADVAAGRWTFAPDEDMTRWWHAQLNTHIERVEALFDPDTGLAGGGIDPSRGWSVERRLALATDLRDGQAPGGAYAEAWDTARSEIAASPLYDGIGPVAVQMGLVPIGADPESGLQEFWHVASGSRPERDASGALRMTEDSGIVVVLVPGGTFWMGASREFGAPHNYDPDAHDREAPVHEHELSPYFVGKHEVGQGQWLRLTGRRPSVFGPDGDWLEDWCADPRPATYLSPVNMVSWTECMTTLERFGLTLPTEAQWEYAARAGSEEVRWTGDVLLTAEGAVNLADAFANFRDPGAYPEGKHVPDFEDGFLVHAPIDTLAPNGFGLHHVLGNLWEWCADPWRPNFRACVADPTLRRDPRPAGEERDRVSRGGCYRSLGDKIRSASRAFLDQRTTGDLTGLRVAMSAR